MSESGREPGYICFAAQDWWYQNRAHSDFQLMRNIAASRRVLVVNGIGMRMPRMGRSTHSLRRIFRKARSVAKLLRQPVPGFWVLSPAIIPFYGIPLARSLNARLVRAQVAMAARHIGISCPVVFVTIPTAWDAIQGLHRRRLVFNRSDKHSEFREANKEQLQAFEQALIREADHVVYVSRSLMEEERSLAGNRAYFLDHGVDLDRFVLMSSAPEPADMRGIPRPRIGFFGALDPELVDFDLLYKLAIEVPEAHLVLIGDATASMTELAALENVHCLGFRPYEEIPAYGACFDVAIMPWVRSDWIRQCNPIKLKEYLALGLPVVSTDFLELRRYDRVVRIAKDSDDFVTQVRLALKGEDTLRPAERRATVAGDSWATRAAQLITLCERPPIP